MKAFLILIAMIAAPAFAQVGGTPPHNPALQPIAAELKARARAWGDLDQALSRLKTPKPYAGLWFKECGNPNAFFDRQSRKIWICYELAHDAAKVSGAGGAGASGFVLFVVLHEFGHALIQSADTPPLGREEDAADQIAAVLVRKMGAAAPVVVDMMKTDWRPKWDEGIAGRAAMADEHSLTPQRRANVICWIGEAGMIDAAVRARILTPQRAARCNSEAEQAERAVTALMR